MPEGGEGVRCTVCGVENPAGMRFCGGCATPLDDTAAPPSPAPEQHAERRHMTVMFCDLVGSTPLAEQVDPEDLRDLLGEFQDACVGAIERYAGHVSKFMGDGLLAYFGYPIAHEDDPRRAVHAGLDIVDAVTAMGEDVQRRYGCSLQVRVGVHTGTVVAGEMRSGELREEFAIVGETPNIAARIEGAAEPNTVAISEVTQRLVENHFETDPRGRIPLKGVSRPLGVFRVTGETGQEGHLDVDDADRRTPLIGRDAELTSLTSTWDSVVAGAGAVVHLHGEAGIGKSRLAHALSEQDALQGATLQVWRCSPYNDNSLLYPIRTFLERRLELEGRGPTEQLERIRAASAEAGIESDRTTSLLADLLLLPDAPTPAGGPLAPLDARAALFSVLESLLVLDGSRHPMLLVIEDLHWADPTTIEFVNRVIERIGDLPIMAVVTTRPGFVVPLGEADLEIQLRPLSSQDVDEMIGSASEAVRADVAARVVSAADGVPLFVEEMLRMLTRTDTAADVDEPDSVTDADPAVPATLQGLLTARLDRLGPAREAAQVASVLGREVREDVLVSLLADQGEGAELMLDRLVREDVLRRSSQLGARRFEFTHALLQEAAYSTLLRRRRRDVHRQAAELITREHREIAQREPEVVARHFSRAGHHDQAIEYWRAAGMRALGGAAYLEAIGHFEEALIAVEELEPSPDQDAQLIDVLTLLAAARQAGLGYADPGVEELYVRARALCEATGDEARLVGALRGQWLFSLLRADYETAESLGRHVLQLGENRDDHGLLVEGHTYVGMCASFCAELELARHHLETAIELHRPTDQVPPLFEMLGDTYAMTLGYLAPVLWLLGEVEESQKRSDENLALIDGSATPITVAQAWGMRSLYHLGRKEIDRVQHWTEKVIAFCDERPIPYWRHLSTIVHGWFVGRTSDLEAGRREVERGLDEYLATGARLGLPSLLILLADLHRAAGDFDLGLEAIGRAERHVLETGERDGHSGVLRSKGELLLGGDEPDTAGARAAFEQSLDVAREQGSPLAELRATAKLVKFRRRHGQDDGVLVERLRSLCRDFAPDCEVADLREARALLDPPG